MSTSQPATLSAHALTDALIARNPVFNAGGEFLSAHFQAQERLRGTPEGGYGRRPLIGLRLAVDDRRTLSCKPGWTPAKWAYHEGAHVLREPGRNQFDLDAVEVELVAPGIALRMTLTEDSARLGRCSVYKDQSKNIDNIKLVAATLQKLVTDPMTAFVEQQDNCCCGKRLSDITSRLRGIGPECIKYFAHVEEEVGKVKSAPASPARERMCVIAFATA